MNFCCQDVNHMWLIIIIINGSCVNECVAYHCLVSVIYKLQTSEQWLHQEPKILMSYSYRMWFIIEFICRCKSVVNCAHVWYSRKIFIFNKTQYIYVAHNLLQRRWYGPPILQMKTTGGAAGLFILWERVLGGEWRVWICAQEKSPPAVSKMRDGGT